MTTIQLKAEMHHMIDEIPENKISEVFNLLKSVQQPSPNMDKDKLRKFIDKVFKEDDELLRRLAQ